MKRGIILCLLFGKLVAQTNTTVTVTNNTLPIELLEQATHVVFKGECSANEQLAYTILSHYKKPITISYVDHSLVIPHYSINKLPELTALKFTNCPNVDAELTLTTLEHLIALKELQLPVNLGDLPLKEIRALKNINTLTLIDKDQQATKPIESLLTIEKNVLTENTLALKIISDRPISFQEFKNAVTNYDSKPTNHLVVKSYETVTAPIPQLDIPYAKQVVTINDKQHVITSTNGSKVIIPKDAFVTSNGQAVTGNVEVFYREMFNPLDCILSGIPMTYDSAGVTNHFETAGMFEIIAKQNNEELQLAPNKSISISLPATDTASNYNFYTYNDKKGNWSYLNRVNQVSTTVQESEAIRKFQELLQNDKLFDRYDTTSFNSRFESNLYKDTRLIKKIDAFDSKEFRKEMDLVVLPKKFNNCVAFRLNNMTHVHPELYPFRSNNTAWLATTFSNELELTEFLNTNVLFTDIRIVEKENEYTMILKTNRQFYSLSVKPIKCSKNEYSYYADGGQFIMQKYTKAIKRREGNFNRSIALRNVYHNNDIKADLEKVYFKIYKQTTPYMTEEEKAKPYEEWKQLAVNYRKLLEVNKENENNIIRTVNVSSMGIFNCDRIMTEQRKDILAYFFNDTSDSLAIKKSYLINNKYNGVFTYDGSSSGKYAMLSVPEKGNSCLLTINKNGTIGFINKESFKDQLMNGAKDKNVTLSFLPSESLTKKDIKQFLEL